MNAEHEPQPDQAGADLPEPDGSRPESAAPRLAAEAERRLSPLTVVTTAIQHGRSAGLPVLVALFAGDFNPWVLGGTVLVGVLLVVAGIVRYWTVRYQIIGERLEIRSGLISRSRRAIPLERIRGVNVTSTLLHRIFGLAVVRIDAAAGGALQQEEAKLDAIATAEAEQLRVELLRRHSLLVEHEAAVAEEPAAETEAAPAESAEVTYFRMPWRWYLYAVLSPAYLLTPFAVLAALFGFFNQFIDAEVIGAYVIGQADTIWGIVTSRSGLLLLTLVGVVAAILVAMPLFAVVSYMINQWQFTLHRRGEALVTERGLFTRHSVTLEYRRIHGYELHDTLVQRPWALGRLSAIVTGLGGSTSRSALLPLGPRAEVERIVAQALRPFHGKLVAHPAAARSRRLFRAVVPPLLLAGCAAALGWFWVAGGLLAVAVLGVPLGMDRYRSLGHGYDGEQVSVRSGSLARVQATVARSAIIGWRWRQSVFQRRAGLATMKATVGAGSGGYDAIDVDFADSVAFAHAVTPELLAPFLAASAAGAADQAADTSGQEGDRSGGAGA